MKKIIVIALVMLVFLISNIAMALPPNQLNQLILSDNSIVNGGGSNPQQYGSISGTVYGSNGWSTYPLPLAIVTAGGKTAVTNLYGSYTINDLSLQTHAVTASKIGYTSQTFSATLTSGNPFASVSFTLERSGDGGGSQG